MGFPHENSHYTMFQTSDFGSSIHNKSSFLQVSDVHLKNFEQDQARKVSEVNNGDHFATHPPQILIRSSKTLLDAGSKDHRVVLPKAVLDANASIPHRRVLLPQGKPESEMMESTKGASLQSKSSNSTSKQMSAYKEELEFWKLKLRYIQNDIEFKKSQIVSSRASQPSTSISQNRKRNRDFALQGSLPATSSSNFYPASHGKSSPVSSASKWTVPAANAQQLYSKSNMAFDCLKQQRSYVKFCLSPSNSNKSAACDWSSQSSSDTRAGELRPASGIGDARRVPSEYMRTVPCSGAHTVHKQLSYVHNPVELTVPSSLFLKGTDNSRTVMPPSNQVTAAGTMNASASVGTTCMPIETGSTPSAYERLGNKHPQEAPRKSVYISPDKRCVIYSSTAAPTVPSNLTQGNNRTLSSLADTKSSSLNNVLGNKVHSVSSAESNSHTSSIGTHGGYPSGTLSEQTSSLSLSKYKLIKNPTNVQADKPRSCPVSKEISTAGHSFFSISTVSKDSLPDVMPTKAAPVIRRGSQASRFSLRSPNLKIQTAAKLVSKYKLKRLSPTSAPQAPPPFFYSKTQFKKSFIFEQRDHKTDGQYASNQHKLDRRSISNGSKKTANSTYSSQTGLLNRKLKIDRRPVLNHSSTVFRDYPKPLSGATPKINKRAKTESSFIQKLNAHEIRNLHKLDRRNVSAALDKFKVSPRQVDSPIRTRQCLSSNIITPVISRNRTKLRTSASVYSWKCSLPPQTKSSQSVTPHNSRFRWTKPNVQAQNSAWQQWRQKIHLLLSRRYRYSRFLKYPSLAATSSIYNKANTKFRDCKSNLVMIHGVVYRSSQRKLTRARRLSVSSPVAKTASVRIGTPAGLKNLARQKTKLISVRGIHFIVDHSGKKLCRTELAASKKSSNSQDVPSSSDISSLNYASRAVLKSIAITTAKYKKNNQRLKIKTPHCIFFARFGKCHRGDKCPYIHDPDKVAVCTRFLRGKCDAKSCPFSHKASVNKMPVCLFYIKGSCSRDNCSYLHVRVNPSAPICKDFRNGFCTLGEKCKKIHSHVCPSFAVTGKCSRAGKCGMLHRMSRKEHEGLAPQARPLKENSVEQQQRDLKVSHVSSSPSTPSPSGKSVPIVSAPLPAQPSFISLDKSYVPLFITLKMNHKPINGTNARKQTQSGLEGIINKEIDQGLSITRSGSIKDTLLNIRPSFLAKKDDPSKEDEQASLPL